MIPVRADRLPDIFNTFPQPGPALAGQLCPACDQPYDGPIALIHIGPGDDLNDQQKARDGRWHTAAAVAVHAHCAGIKDQLWL